MINAPEIPRGDEDFWEMNSQYVFVFEEFYKKDKSKDKNKSSKIMWALYHKLHPDSVFYSMKDKDEEIKKKFLKQPKFKWEDYEEEELLFKETILSQAERSLLEFNNTMRKRDAFLKDQEYDMENAKDLDTILANTAKLYQLYGKIMKDLTEEKLKRGKAGKPLSSSDANRI